MWTYEIDTDRTDVTVRIRIVLNKKNEVEGWEKREMIRSYRKSKQQARFSHARIADQQQLEQVIAKRQRNFFIVRSHHRKRIFHLLFRIHGQ